MDYIYFVINKLQFYWSYFICFKCQQYINYNNCCWEIRDNKKIIGFYSKDYNKLNLVGMGFLDLAICMECKNKTQ
jgi:hypothetical protein